MSAELKKKVAERRSLRQRQLAEDWQAIARTPEGRRVIADLMQWGWVFQQIEENDPIALARMVGENNFAKRISRYLNLTPDMFVESNKQNDEVDREWLTDDVFRELMGVYMAPPKMLNS